MLQVLPDGIISTAPPVASSIEVPGTVNDDPDLTMTEFPSFSVRATRTGCASWPAVRDERVVPP